VQVASVTPLAGGRAIPVSVMCVGNYPIPLLVIQLYFPGVDPQICFITQSLYQENMKKDSLGSGLELYMEWASANRWNDQDGMGPIVCEPLNVQNSP